MNIKDRVDAFRTENVIPSPNQLDSIRFAVTEATEIMECMLREREYVRASNKESDMLLECGQCAMMILTALDVFDHSWVYVNRGFNRDELIDRIAIETAYALDLYHADNMGMMTKVLHRALGYVSLLIDELDSDIETVVDMAIDNLRSRA